MIWKHALPGPRYLQSMYNEEYCGGPSTWFLIMKDDAVDPVNLQVNNESRQLALQHYRRRDVLDEGCMYIDPKIDILLQEFWCGHEGALEQFQSEKSRRGMEGENLALRLEGFCSRLAYSCEEIQLDRTFCNNLRVWLEPCSSRTLLFILDLETNLNAKKLPLRERKLMEWVRKLFKEIATAQEAKNIVWTVPSMEIKSVDGL